MIVLYQTIIVLAFVAIGYFAFTKYMLKSKFNIINTELIQKKELLEQLVETNKQYEEMLDALEKKSKLSQDQILGIYTKLKDKKEKNENIDVDSRINRLRNSG
jgi:Tfp pilus assembly protein PilE